MKENKLNTKKVCFAIVIIVLALISSVSISVFSYARNINSLNIRVGQDSKITKIQINGSDSRLDTFLNSDRYIEEEKLCFNSQDNLQIELFVTDQIEIEFEEIGNAIVEVDNKVKKITENNFVYANSMKNIISNSINIYMLIAFMVYIPIMYIVLKGIANFYNKLENKELKIRDILIFAISIFIIYISIFHVLYAILGILILAPITGIIFYNYVKVRRLNLENIYVSIAVIVGITMIFVMAPFNVPDETSHMIRAYKDASLSFVEDDGYIEMPRCFINFADRFAINVQSTDNGITGRMYLSEYIYDCDYSIPTEYLIDYRNVKNLSFVPYLPATAITFVGKLIGLTPLVILLLSRFANLLIVILCSYIAIRKVPHFKKAFLVVGLFPVFIQQAAAVNMDYLTNAIAILMASYIISMIYQKKKVSKKQLVVLGIMTILLALGKFGYFPIMLLLFLVPNEKFSSKKKALIYKIGFLIFLFVFSYMMNSTAAASGADGGTELEKYYGLKYIFTNFIDTMIVYFRTIFLRIDQDVFRGYFNCFGYSTITHHSIPYVCMIAIYLVMILSHDEDDKKLTFKERIMYLIIPVLVIGLVYTIAFSRWTQVGQPTIWGIQARYFLPVMPLLYIACSNTKFELNVKNKNGLYALLTSIAYILSFLTIIVFFS